MPFKIVTDSCANLTDEVINKFDITILPLTFMVDGEQHTSYKKNEKSNLPIFYKMMREGKVVTTSLPNLVDSKKEFEKILESGNDLLFISFSSGLSGTYAALDLVCKELASQFEDRKIYTVDTLAAAAGQGMLVWMAAEMREEGKPIEEVRDWLEDNKLHLAHWFTVDDLHFLERGGRVSKTAAFAGTVLNIKPVLHVDDEGHLIPMEKVRGRKKSIEALAQHMKKTMIEPYEYKVLISHGDCPEDAELLANKAKEVSGVKDVCVNCLDPVIGAHSGPGTLALFYLATTRD